MDRATAMARWLGNPEDCGLFGGKTKSAGWPTLLLGELQILRVVSPRHPVGEPFDVGAEMCSRHDIAGGPAERAQVFPEHARTLAEKGLLREEAGGLFSLTEQGEAYWKECLTGSWKHARQGAGVAWKKPMT